MSRLSTIDPCQIPPDIANTCATIAACCESVYEWLMRCGENSQRLGDFETAIRCYQECANYASHHGSFGRLGDSRIELALQAIGQTIPVPRRKQLHGDTRYLHIFTEGYDTGGHTALCMQWILSQKEGCTHNLLFTNRLAKQPEKLTSAVKLSGGRIFQLSENLDLVERARQLREIAFEESDIVVLHIHAWDPLPSIAFSVSSGPRIIFLNHAYHVFWVGSLIADVVFDLNPIASYYSKRYRGVENSQIVPIPLDSKAINTVEFTQLRNKTRAFFAIPESSVVFLTVGAKCKYNSTSKNRFDLAAYRILTELENSYIVAVGLPNSGVWKTLSDAFPGRFLPVGVTPDLDAFHAIADIYLETFPFTSLTALLESCVYGIPCVRAPRDIPKLYRSDGPEFDFLFDPPDLDEYVSYALKLAKDTTLRHRIGSDLSLAIQSQHYLQNWLKYLKSALAAAPLEHSLHRTEPKKIPIQDRDHWIQIRRLAEGWSPMPLFVPRNVFVDRLLVNDLTNVLGLSPVAFREYLSCHMSFFLRAAIRRMVSKFRFSSFFGVVKLLIKIRFKSRSLG